MFSNQELYIEATTGADPRFHQLCLELDRYLNGTVGENQKNYDAFNGVQDLNYVCLLFCEGVPCGCGGYKAYDAWTAEIKRVFVQSTCRAQGFGRAILENLEYAARMDGYQKLILETGKQLIPAQKLYQKCGFNYIPNYVIYQKMESSVCMEKLLAEPIGDDRMNQTQDFSAKSGELF